MIVLKVIGIVLLALLGILIIILFHPLVVELSFLGGKAEYRVRFLFLNIFPKKTKLESELASAEEEVLADIVSESVALDDKISESDKKDSDSSESVKDTAEQADKPEQKKSKRGKKPKKVRVDSDSSESLLDKLSAKLELLKFWVDIGQKPLLRLLGGIQIRDIYIDFQAANEDAAVAAISYGALNALVYNVIGYLNCIFSLSKKSISIGCKYNSNESRYDCSCKICLRPSTVIAAAVVVAVKYVYRRFLCKEARSLRKSQKIEREA